MEKNVGTVERVVSMIAGGALMGFGLTRGRLTGAVATAAGGGLFLHGLTGHSRAYDALGIDSLRHEGVNHPLNRQVHVHESIAIDRPPRDIYAFWRHLPNVAAFLEGVELVEIIDDLRSRWRLHGPLDTAVEWEAQIVEDREAERLSWRVIESQSDLEHEGIVRFESAPGQRGTIVRVDLHWSPPGGVIGAAAARLVPQSPARRVREDLRRLRQLIETGEIARAQAEAPKGQTGDAAECRNQRAPLDEVDEASRESFPASDAPAYTMR